jgi:hypothetical protein
MRPPSFPLAAKAHLSKYRAAVYYRGGVFLADVDAMSDDEAERIGLHYFMLSNRATRTVEKIEVANLDMKHDER